MIAVCGFVVAVEWLVDMCLSYEVGLFCGLFVVLGFGLVMLEFCFNLFAVCWFAGLVLV